MNFLCSPRGLLVILGLTASGAVLLRPGNGARGEETQNARDSAPGGALAGAAASDRRVAALEERLAALEADLAKLRADVPRIAAANVQRGLDDIQFAKEHEEAVYPNTAPLYEPEIAKSNNPYYVKSPAQKAPPLLSPRRRSRAASAAKTRAGGGELVDGYYRTPAGAEAMTDVTEALQALKDLGEDIRFSRSGSQLSVRATRHGQQLVRALITYYEAEAGAGE